MNSLGSVNCNESRKWEWNLIWKNLSEAQQKRERIISKLLDSRSWSKKSFKIAFFVKKERRAV
jgi:hypothetical protein